MKKSWQSLKTSVIKAITNITTTSSYMGLTPRNPLETLAPITLSPLLEPRNVGTDIVRQLEAMTLDRTTRTQNPRSTPYLAMGPPMNVSIDFCLGSEAPGLSPRSPGLSIRPYILGSLLGAPSRASAGVSLTCTHVAQRVLSLSKTTSVRTSGCSLLTRKMLLQPGHQPRGSLSSRPELAPQGLPSASSRLPSSPNSLASQPTAPHLRGGFLSCTVSMALPAAAQTASMLHPPGARPANPSTLPLSAPTGSERRPGRAVGVTWHSGGRIQKLDAKEVPLGRPLVARVSATPSWTEYFQA